MYLCKFLVIDTQLMVGGRRLQLHPEDYITAALELYLDIFYIFIVLLGASNN